MALTVTPVKGNPILATWGAEVRDRTNQAFANYNELVASWPNAPEGAQAITLADYKLWVRRGGLWQPPLTLPLGLYFDEIYNNPISITASGVPGTADWAKWFDQYTLLSRRLYMVQFSARVEAQAGPYPITYGGVVNVYTGTSYDYPLQYNGAMPGFVTGQEVLVYGWPLERLGSAYRAGTVGFFRTGGNPGVGIGVAFQHVIIASPNGARVLTGQRRISVIDQGPA